jgi:Fur family transcriptional regulator, ferric uptake regulator
MAGRARPTVAERLGARGRRLTGQRVIVAEALARERTAVSAQELHERIRARRQRIGLATVYRSLEAQVADGMATRLERPGHVSAYVACAPEHHHHLVCTTCERVEDVAEELLGPVLRSIRARHGFRVDHARLDFYGSCLRCGSRRLKGD